MKPSDPQYDPVAWNHLAMVADEVTSDIFTSETPMLPFESEEYKKLQLVSSANHFLKYYNKQFLKTYSSPLLLDVASDILNKYRAVTN
jgi:hypothetical protein